MASLLLSPNLVMRLCCQERIDHGRLLTRPVMLQISIRVRDLCLYELLILLESTRQGDAVNSRQD
jgi:hypothetical protein